MARNPDKADGPGKPGPAPVKRNKQRLTKLTAAEIKAAQTGGWLDERLPRNLIARRLSDEGGHEFNIDQVVELLRRRMGWVRLMAAPEAVRKEPKEIAQQARDTAAVIEELLDRRLRFMHPDLEARVDGILFPALGTYVTAIRSAVGSDLRRLRAAAIKAAREIEAMPVKTGPKSTERKRAELALSDYLQAHSKPRLAKRDARSLAADLIAICEAN